MRERDRCTYVYIYIYIDIYTFDVYIHVYICSLSLLLNERCPPRQKSRVERPKAKTEPFLTQERMYYKEAGVRLVEGGGDSVGNYDVVENSDVW